MVIITSRLRVTSGVAAPSAPAAARAARAATSTAASDVQRVAYLMIGAASRPPAWRSLLDEGLHPLEGGFLHHVAGHGLAGGLVGAREPELGLAGEKLLAHGHRDARLGEDPRHQPLGLRLECVR